MNKIFYLALIWILTATTLKAQDPEFSQFYASPINTNPALAGSNYCPRVSLNYRNQWPEVGKIQTYAVSFDKYIDFINGGVGILVSNDIAGNGDFTTTTLSGVYSYHFKLSRNLYMNMGLQASLVQKKIDFKQLTFEDMIEPRSGQLFTTKEALLYDNISFADFATGFMIHDQNFYAGIALDHITKPNISLNSLRGTELPIKITTHAGINIGVGQAHQREFESGLYLSPNLLFSHQGSFNQLNIGMYASKLPVVAGLWHKFYLSTPHNYKYKKDSFVALLGIELEGLKIGYSYDLSISNIAEFTKASHEISLGLNLDCKRNRKRYHTVKCPSF